MPGAGKNRLALIAGACLIASALLIGIPVDISNALRFFSAGALFGIRGDHAMRVIDPDAPFLPGRDWLFAISVGTAFALECSGSATSGFLSSRHAVQAGQALPVPRAKAACIFAGTSLAGTCERPRPERVRCKTAVTALNERPRCLWSRALFSRTVTVLMRHRPIQVRHGPERPRLSLRAATPCA